jgi:Tlde1 domain
LAGHSRRKPPQKSALIRRLSGAAIACLVLACGWIVYTNILGASAYPTLGSIGFDGPAARLTPKMITRNTADAIAEAFAALPEQTSVAVKPATTTIAAISPEMFNDRFAAAQPQGVESRAAEAAPAPAAPKLAEASRLEAPKAVSAPKLAEAPKSKEAAPPTKVAMNVPPAPAQDESRPARPSALSFSDMAQRAKAAVMSITKGERQSITEKLWGKPSPSGTLLAYASADASVTGGLGNPNSALGGQPPYDRDTAVYDISAHMVYLPDGTQLEAHSGLGSKLDDPSSAKIKMHGVTPPHMYELKPREALFHGVPALRLNPIGGEDAIYGRAGLLAHTYMLGPNGDSNGCVSFKDYNAFLNAYRNLGIKKLAVVVKI